ncbi:MAG: tRNA dimethylallyltransferase [Candidatus Peribacteria bacterium]|nr:tRNA dimethylallyltransferase [Candidatus Peribacteria bacterium]
MRDHILQHKKPLIVIIGPTASGKTGFAIKVAKWIDKELKEDFAEWRSGAEIVNGDSRQLYRGMDIGTAKVTEQEMDKIPHHLFDVLTPDQEVTVAWYKERAERMIEEIQARGNVPILVGGSMLYISAITDGLTPIDPAPPELRARLELEYEQDKGETLYKQLMKIDPDTALAFHKNNKPYVVRAMEIFWSTGRKPSEVKTKDGSKFDVFMFGMDLPKAILDERIEARTEQMLSQGWINEVEHLLDMGYSPFSPGMKSVGYREIAEYIRTGETMSREELAELITRKTRQYAKRQVTWWRNNPKINWIEP